MSLYTLVIQSVELCSCVVVRDMHRNSISLTIVSQWLLHTSRSIFFFFFSTGRSIPVEKCSLKVIKSSIYRTVPPETASVFTTAVKMQSENVTGGHICLHWTHLQKLKTLQSRSIARWKKCYPRRLQLLYFEEHYCTQVRSVKKDVMREDVRSHRCKL